MKPIMPQTLNMKHEDFCIGAEFWTATGTWRCTDVGTRTIVAIKLGLREIERIQTGDGRDRRQITVVADDPSWLNGPPYAVTETVFDEDDIETCYPTRAEMLADHADDSSPPGTEESIG
jgi:hypothetical protein